VTAGEELGAVVGGSLRSGLEVRLHPAREIALGEYVAAPLPDGGSLLGMVTDLSLRSAESGATSWPPPAGDDPAAMLLREVLLDTAVYTEADVQPYLEVREDAPPSQARHLPRHFGRVRRAGQEMLDRAFAVAEETAAIRLGSPLGMDAVTVHVDLEKLFERSAGIFGKSGTGKTVLALQLLDAMVAHSAAAETNRDRTVALIFDMHNDYGSDLKFQGDGTRRRSLKHWHRTGVAVYSLEANAPDTDRQITIGTRDIRPEDLEILRGSTFSGTAQAIDLADECERQLGRDWVDEVLQSDPSPAVIRKLWKDGTEPEEPNWNRVASRLGYTVQTLDSLKRGLRAITRREFVQSGAGQFSEVIDHVVQMLLGGKSAVIQFGKHGSDLASYMLVANMLSRRIWEHYQQKMDAARGNHALEPNHLVIVIEEAHKFVDKSVAGQTIFGQIARELRKFNVTLLIIDQRPSQIDSEVLSQVGTKFCLQLDSEADIEAVIGGITGRASLKQVVASLESRRQALVFGHAMPMPVVLQPPELTADYRAGSSLRERLGAPPSAPVTRLY
jgi:DNA helicase HerA-like ATPase